MNRSHDNARPLPNQRGARFFAEARDADWPVHMVTTTAFVFAVLFFAVVTTISYIDRDYFERLLISDIERVAIDPIMTGSTSSAQTPPDVEPMPAQRIVRAHTLQPQDFSIVMVFGEEAHLASPGEIWRVRPGMIVPGLGEILSIEEGENGGTIRAENAVLTGVPRD